MSLQFLESFDGYSSSELDARWQQVFNCLIDPAGRNGKGLRVAGGGIGKTLPYATSWVVGFAWRGEAFQIGTGPIYGNQTPGVGGNIISVFVESDASVSLRDNTGAIMGNTGSGPGFSIHNSTWYYFELKFTLNGSGTSKITISEAYLRINGQNMFGPVTGTTNYSPSQTLYPALPAQSNQHFFPSMGTGYNFFDDIYIFDQTGSVNNDFIGDPKILVIFPDQDIVTPWTPSGGPPSYKMINEYPPDYDSTYIYDNNNNDFDNFYWQHLPSFYGTVICVQYTVFARKDDEGSRAIRLTLGGGPNQYSNPFYLGDTYVYYEYPLDTDNGTNWTVTNFNAESFGVSVFTVPPPP